MHRNLQISFALFIMTWLVACQSEKPTSPVEPVGQSIGSAHLTPDGLLEVFLTAEAESGMRGHAFFVYKKGTPQYVEMMNHVGGLKRGESKPVPAYP